MKLIKQSLLRRIAHYVSMCLIVLVVFGGIGIDCLAQIPKFITYQGLLMDAGHNPKPDGIYEFILRVYDDDSLGTVLWSVERRIELSNGCFATVLTEYQAGDGFDTLSFRRPYWLEIEVGLPGQVKELLPGRVPLASVPYAFYAESAGRLLTLPNMSINDLSNVETPVLIDGYVLKWNAGTGNWEARPDSVGGGGAAVYNSGIGINIDTGSNTISAATNDPLWNANALQNRTIDNRPPLSGQVLKWDGNSWRPDDDETGSGNPLEIVPPLGGDGTLADPLRIDRQGAANDQVLRWNDTTQSWTAGYYPLWKSARITGNGTRESLLDLAQQGATHHQVLKWDDTNKAWVPGDDIGGSGGSVVTTPRIRGSGTINDSLDLARQGAGSKQVLTWQSNAWKPGWDIHLRKLDVLSSNDKNTGFWGTRDNAGYLEILGNNGIWNVIVESEDHNTNYGRISVHDESGAPKSQMGINTQSAGAITINGANGENNIIFSTDVHQDHGWIATADETGEVRANMQVDLNGAGVVTLQGPDASRNVVIGPDAMNSDHGSVTIYDESGREVAGMNNAIGIWGKNKSFIVPDPSHSGRRIKYSCIEGPESAIYTRGKASLSNGRAEIRLPEHFATLAVDSSITVSLTPRSPASLGLAAVEVSSTLVQVAELGGGSGNYAFDYVIYAVRKGYEDYEVYLYADENGRYPMLEGEMSSASKGQSKKRRDTNR